jgi:hypothetical protein
MSICIIQLMAYPAELPSIIAAAAGFALVGPIRRQLALATKRIRRPQCARSNTR